jgi:folate-dependent phosphoribosylglycinamide formyltransferase PurN
MTPVRIFDPEKAGGPMRVAGFLSGSGTNIRRLLEHQGFLERAEGAPPFKVVFLFSDRSDGGCRGEAIALEYGLPYISYDIRRFHKIRGVKRDVSTPEGLNARRDFDSLNRTLIASFEIDLIALGGYMSYTTIKRCVNVHPADLSIRDTAGRRRFTGDNAVYDAICAGERELRASTLYTDEGVDSGPLLMVSEALQVELPAPLEKLLKEKERLTKVAQKHQERLKEVGDWKIFPRTVELIARGRFSLDEKKRAFIDGIPLDAGYREGG